MSKITFWIPGWLWIFQPGTPRCLWPPRSVVCEWQGAEWAVTGFPRWWGETGRWCGGWGRSLIQLLWAIVAGGLCHSLSLSHSALQHWAMGQEVKLLQLIETHPWTACASHLLDCYSESRIKVNNVPDSGFRRNSQSGRSIQRFDYLFILSFYIDFLTIRKYIGKRSNDDFDHIYKSN